jgi:hypothetical protein
MVRFNHTHIELKVDVNIPDIPVQMAVDNVRLYPNPAHNPVTIVVYTGVSGNKPKLPIHNQKVQIFEEGSTRLLGEALTDEGGEARVSLRTDVLFPVAATITIIKGQHDNGGTDQIPRARQSARAFTRVTCGRWI